MTDITYPAPMQILDEQKEDTMLIETPDYLKTKVTDLESKIATLTKQAETVTMLRREIESMKSEIKEFVTEGISNGSVDTDGLRDFANCFNIEMTQRVQFTVTTTFNGYVDVDLGVDVDEIAWELGNSITANLEFDGSIEGVDNFDYETNDVEVTDVETM